jgi:hypothetical protein
MIGK